MVLIKGNGRKWVMCFVGYKYTRYFASKKESVFNNCIIVIRVQQY